MSAARWRCRRLDWTARSIPRPIFAAPIGYAVILRRRKADNPDKEERVKGVVESVDESVLTLMDGNGQRISTAMEAVVVGKYDI